MAVLILATVPVGALVIVPDTVAPGVRAFVGIDAGADAASLHKDAAREGAWPILDAAQVDASAWASLPVAETAAHRFTLPAGTETYTVRMGPSGPHLVDVDVLPAVPTTPSGTASALALPGTDVALCTPTQSGLHYTTTPDEQETCPFTWHDGPIHETVLTCAVAGDCTIAGQDAPTGGTFWVICFGGSASTHVWGVLPELEVQCQSGSIGPSPHTWTRWNSWCRVFGIAPGTAACGHHYG